MDQTYRPPWTQPGWIEQASAWVHAELERRAITVNGPIAQPHLRPWSTVLQVPTSAGALYFKATSPLTGHEPALVQALARWRPECVPVLFAVDLARGWILMSEAGQRLREIIRPSQDMRHWYPALRLYADVQRDLAGRVPDLLALGAPDRRLAVLPSRYERLLDDTDALRVDQPGGITSAQYERLRALAPRVAELCARLAEHRIPETLNHGDFHDANVFLRDGRCIFIDWGDSCVSHPFFSLRTVLVSAEISLGLEEDSPALQSLCDVHLEPWTSYESRADVLAAYDLARRLASINGALTWHHVVAALEEPLRAEYAEPVPALLQEFLSAETAPSA
jgi:hypothetical protein